MAEDASGDGGDDRSVPPTEPDGPQPADDRQSNTDDRQPTVDDWTLPDREKRSGDDPDEYRIPLDLSGGGDENGDGSADAAETDDQRGPEPSSAPVEPGTPTLEGAVFVFLGAIAMLLVLFRLFGLVL